VNRENQVALELEHDFGGSLSAEESDRERRFNRGGHAVNRVRLLDHGRIVELGRRWIDMTAGRDHERDFLLAQPTGENVILVEENNRLESFSIDSHSQIKERLVRPADSSVLIAFDKQHTCWPGTGRGRGCQFGQALSCRRRAKVNRLHGVCYLCQSMFE